MGLTPWKKPEFLDPQPSVTPPRKENPQNQRWKTRERLCLSGLTLCVPCNSTSQQKPATTEIEAQEIRWYLSVCPCCDVPPQDHHRQCDAAGDQTNEKSRRALVIMARMKICWIWKHVEMLSQTKPFPFLKNTMSCKKTWMNFSECKPIDFMWNLYVKNDSPLPDHYMTNFIQQYNECIGKLQLSAWPEWVLNNNCQQKLGNWPIPGLQF